MENTKNEKQCDIQVKQYADLIRDEEIAIRECQSILEYCL